MNKNYLEILKEYDFCDSIISNIYWSSDMRNICVDIDYYLSKNNEVKIEFINCFDFSCKLREENLNDIWSQLTLLSIRIEKNLQNQIIANFYDSFNFPFLKIRSLDVKIKSCQLLYKIITNYNLRVEKIEFSILQ